MKERGRFWSKKESFRDFRLGKQTQIYDLSLPLTSNPIGSLQRKLRSSPSTTTRSIRRYSFLSSSWDDSTTTTTSKRGKERGWVRERDLNLLLKRERERESAWESYESLDFFFGSMGGFQMFFFFFFEILILCLKIDIIIFCDVFVCQVSSTIFEKVAINFFLNL